MMMTSKRGENSPLLIRASIYEEIMLRQKLNFSHEFGLDG